MNDYYEYDKNSFFCHDSGMPQPSQELKEALRFFGEELQFKLFPLKGRSYTPEGQKEKNNNQKTPWRKGWQDMASSDRQRLNLWIAQGAWAFGVHTGKPLPGGGFLTVVDCDKAQVEGLLDGIECFKALYKKNEAKFPNDMLSTITPSGGYHFYFRSKNRLKNEVRKTIPMVDIRGLGGIIVIPGSRLLMNDNTVIKTYRATSPFSQMQLYDMPDWLEELIRKRQFGNVETVENDKKEKKKNVKLNKETLLGEGLKINVKNVDLAFLNLRNELRIACTPSQEEAIYSKCKEWCTNVEKAIEGTRNSTLFGTAVCLARLMPQFISTQICIDLCQSSAFICQQNTLGGKPFPNSEINFTIQSAIQYRYRKGSGLAFNLMFNTTKPKNLIEKELKDFENLLAEKKRQIEEKIKETQVYKRKTAKF